jgi:hypothetical protein
MSEEHMWKMKQKNALRDYFAAQAMNAYLTEDDAPIDFTMIADRAYQMADAMMKRKEI